jgi:hypothetical protein
MRDIFPNAEYRRMHSLMPHNEVEETREWFQNTDEGYLLAVNMITEGAHYKGVNTVIMFRRTQSSLVFNQQLGRIITLARNGDPHAIVFDLVNNAENLDTEKGFSASLRESYAQRKARGGKEKSEQIIVEDYAEAISDVLRRIKESGRTRAVICLELNKTYSSVIEAEYDTGVYHSHICACCNKKMFMAGPYHWLYLEDYDEGYDTSTIIQLIESGRVVPKPQKKEIVCLETGQVFNSVREAAEYVSVERAAIRSCCQGKNQTCQQLHWAYLSDVQGMDYQERIKQIENTRNQNQKRKIKCIETQIIYDSIKEAQESLGIANISAVCSGKRKTAGGYHWEYVEEDA